MKAELTKAALEAAKTGDIELLKAFFESDQDNRQLSTEILYVAVFHGQIEVLQLSKQYDHSFFDARVHLQAAQGGQLECLKYLMDHVSGLSAGASSGSWFSVLATAAKYGHLDCMQLAYENMSNHIMWHNIKEVADSAAGAGQLDCLKFCFEKRMVVDHCSVTDCAAIGGHLDCLKYAHEQGCVFTSECSLSAIENGNYQCFRYIVEQGGQVPWNKVYKHLDLNLVKCVLGKHDWLVGTLLKNKEEFRDKYPRLCQMLTNHREALESRRKYVMKTLSDFCCADVAQLFVDKFMTV